MRSEGKKEKKVYYVVRSTANVFSDKTLAWLQDDDNLRSCGYSNCIHCYGTHLLLLRLLRGRRPPLPLRQKAVTTEEEIDKGAHKQRSRNVGEVGSIEA